MSDRLALANAIEDAGIPHDKAQRVASVIFDAIHDRVATKADVQAGEAALKSELQALRHDVQGNGAATRADIAASMAELKSDVVAVHPHIERQDANVEQIGSRTVSRLGALMVVILRHRHRGAALLATALVIELLLGHGQAVRHVPELGPLRIEWRSLRQDAHDLGDAHTRARCDATPSDIIEERCATTAAAAGQGGRS